MTADSPAPLPLAITMGCPASIGPEIIVRLFGAPGTEKKNKTLPACVVVGDMAVLRQAAAEQNIDLDLAAWQPGQPLASGALSVLDMGQVPHPVTWGQPDLKTARAMITYIETAVQGCMQKQFAGMVTCPISKEGLKLAGSPFPGHTEMLARLTRADRFKMMLAGERLRVVLVTIHEPLARVPELLTSERIRECITVTRQALERDLGMTSPRIAVAGLNPHCGENGMFGNEEQEIIAPAIASCQGEGEISGPWPPDTVFYQAAQGRHDAVVCMYHDQGLIPFKLLHFRDGVNITLGLPIVRTSVDHGTAYDIAGQGIAHTDSLRAAIMQAAAISRNRTKRQTQ